MKSALNIFPPDFIRMKRADSPKALSLGGRRSNSGTVQSAMSVRRPILIAALSHRDRFQSECEGIGSMTRGRDGHLTTRTPPARFREQSQRTFQSNSL